jgi:hypothetical protein
MHGTENLKEQEVNICSCELSGYVFPILFYCGEMSNLAVSC